MTDRPIIFTGSQPRSADMLQGWKNAMIGDGALATVIGGTCGGNPNTTFKGFAATATNPPSMTINIAPGYIFSPAVIDLTPYSTLGVDTTHSTTKIGINLDTTPITFVAPTSNPQIFVIQAQLQTVDTGAVTLQYFDSENTNQVYNGPNNTGVSQFTNRQDVCVFNVVPGTPGPSPVIPSVTAGWVGMYVVTIPANATSINQSMIATYSGARFLNLSLCDLQSGVGGGGITSITAGTGLTGGTITTSGTIALANTAVTAGSYTNSNLTVNAQGQITSIANGTSGGGGAGTVTSITAGTGLTGGTITTIGTIAMPTIGAVGTFTNANITVDVYGRVITAANGSAGGAQFNYQPQIDILNSEFNTLNGQITVINGEITTIQNNQTTTNTTITAIQANLTTLNNNYNTVNTNLTLINNQLQPQRIRYRLQGTLDVYVNGSTGNDTTASATVSGYNPLPLSNTPFQSLQTAWNKIINAYDISGQTVNFHVADGTYTTGIVASGMTGLTDTGHVNIIGNVTTPGNCIINKSQGNCFQFSQNIGVKVSGFRLSATMLAGDYTTGCCISATFSNVEFDAIEFGTCDNNHMMAFAGASIYATVGSGDGTVPSAKGYKVVGNAANAHADVEYQGVFASVRASVTINAGVSCAFWYRSKGGSISTYQTQYNSTQGGAVGQRYTVFANGSLDNGGVDPNNGPATAQGQVLPGNSNGSTASGGQVI